MDPEQGPSIQEAGSYYLTTHLPRGRARLRALQVGRCYGWDL
jgi:hypothetical protein